MQEVTYINPLGESVVIAVRPPYVFEKLLGTGAVAGNPITTQAPNQDGVTVHKVTLVPREMQLSLHLEGVNADDLYSLRQSLARVMNPKLCNPPNRMGEFLYTNSAGTYAISGMVRGGITVDDMRIENFERVALDIFCPDPYWRSAEVFGTELVFVEEGFSFVASVPAVFGQTGFKRTINTGSNVDVPMEILIYGPTVNPRLNNLSNGQFMQVNRAISAGDILYINTAPAGRKIEIRRGLGGVETALNYLDLESTFLQLGPGPNNLEYTAAQLETKGRIKVKYSSRYPGV